MNFRNMIIIAVVALLSLSVFAQGTFDDSTPSDAVDSDAETDFGAPSPEPDSGLTSSPPGNDNCTTQPDGSVICATGSTSPPTDCQPVSLDADGTKHCTPEPGPTGTTLPPTPEDDDDSDTDTDTESGNSSSSSSSSSSTGSGSSGAGGKPYVCNGVGFKLEEGMVCTGKTTESVFEGTCCSVPGTASEAASEEAPIEAAELPGIEIPAEEELVSSLPAGEVAALPTEDNSTPSASPSTGLFGLLGNPQAVGLGFIILAVLLLAGYWYSEQQKK